MPNHSFLGIISAERHVFTSGSTLGCTRLRRALCAERRGVSWCVSLLLSRVCVIILHFSLLLLHCVRCRPPLADRQCRCFHSEVPRFAAQLYPGCVWAASVGIQGAESYKKLHLFTVIFSNFSKTLLSYLQRTLLEDIVDLSLLVVFLQMKLQLSESL